MESRTFNHKEAQEFELNWQKQYIKETFASEYEKWQQRKANGIENTYVDSFTEEPELREKVKSHIINRHCLEFGCGSAPQLRESWNAKNRIVIDPLALDYDNAERELFSGLTFFDGLKIHSQNAEIVIPELVNTIDGVILCRNMLDHSAEPYKIIDNIATYAAKGCYLLLWTDVYHLGGGDEGHHSISQNGEDIKRYLLNLGFAYLSAAPKQRSEEASKYFIDFGGVFIKEK